MVFSALSSRDAFIATGKNPPRNIVLLGLDGLSIVYDGYQLAQEHFLALGGKSESSIPEVLPPGQAGEQDIELEELGDEEDMAKEGEETDEGEEAVEELDEVVVSGVADAKGDEDDEDDEDSEERGEEPGSASALAPRLELLYLEEWGKSLDLNFL